MDEIRNAYKILTAVVKGRDSLER